MPRLVAARKAARDVDDVGRVAGLAGRDRRQQIAVAGGFRDQRAGFDAAGARFEQPVAAQGGTAGAVVGGIHIGAGEAGEAIDKGLPGRALGHVTAVEQQVGATRKAGTPLGEAVGVGVELVTVQHRGADHQLAALAVGEDVHGLQRGVLVLAEPAGDLVHAVAGQIEHHHLDPRLLGLAAALQGLVEEPAVIGDPRIDEHHLVGAGRFGALAGRQVDRLAATTRRQQQRLLARQPGLLGRVGDHLHVLGRRRRQHQRLGRQQHAGLDDFDNHLLAHS